MRQILPHRLLKNLSGKEVFQAIVCSSFAECAGKEASFSQAEIDVALSELRSRPHEMRSLMQWKKSVRMMQLLQSEARISALHAIWRLDTIAQMMARGIGNSKQHRHDAAEFIAVTKEEAHGHALIEAYILNALFYETVLAAFCDIFGIDIAVSIRDESTHLRTCIDNFNEVASLFEARNGVDDAAPLQHFSYASTLFPKNFQQQCVNAIETAPLSNKTFPDVVTDLFEVAFGVSIKALETLLKFQPQPA